jgi:hypothetical protein
VIFSAEVHYAIKSTIRSRQLVFHLFAYFGGVYTKYGKYYDRNGRGPHVTLRYSHNAANGNCNSNGGCHNATPYANSCTVADHPPLGHHGIKHWPASTIG